MAVTTVRRSNQPLLLPFGSDEESGTPWTCPALVWARSTGRIVDLRAEPWLSGPVGTARPIGTAYFVDFARQAGWRLRVNAPDAGLMARFDDLRADDFDPSRVHPRIRDFYEHTANYRLDLESYWCRCIRPFGWLINVLFSRRLQQLNLPLARRAPPQCITNEVLQLCDAETDEVRTTGWLRRCRTTGDVVYAGIYAVAPPHDAAGPHLKAVYPLPGGNATVLFRPVASADGSLQLLSKGHRFGDPGFYFLVRRTAETVWAKYLPAMTEALSLHVDRREELSAHHIFRLGRIPFLTLQYALTHLGSGHTGDEAGRAS